MVVLRLQTCDQNEFIHKVKADFKIGEEEWNGEWNMKYCSIHSATGCSVSVLMLAQAWV